MTLTTPTLNTDRLLLRPFTDTDADPLFAMHASRQVMRYWDSAPWQDRARSDRFIARCAELAAQDSGVRVAVERGSDGAFVGWCALMEWNPDFRSASLGFCFAEAMWGHGYATEGHAPAVGVGLRHVEVEPDPGGGRHP